MAILGFAGQNQELPCFNHLEAYFKSYLAPGGKWLL
jgi:hypothetical protein